MRLSDAIERFLLQLEAAGRSPHTTKQHQAHLELLARWLAGEGRAHELEAITDRVLAEFLVSSSVRLTSRDRVRKASSTNVVRCSLKSCFSWLHRAGLVAEDPSRLIRYAIVAPPIPRGLTDEEEDRLIKAIRRSRGYPAKRDLAMVQFMLGTGVRLTSALAIEVQDVDLGSRSVLLRRTKGGQVQRVLMGEETARRIGKFIGARREGWLFPDESGAQITSRQAQRRFREWREAARIPRAVTPHSLRHSFAARLYAETRDLLLIRRALGHRSLSAALTYAYAADEDLRLALR